MTTTGVPASGDLGFPDGHAYVGGRWCTAQSGATFASHDPATGELVAHAADMGAHDAAAAVLTAHEAFGPWAERTARERGDVLSRWAAGMRSREDTLATLLTREQGKPLAESVAEVRYAADFFDWFAAEGQRAYGRVIPSNTRDARIFTVRRPSGVAGIITPWNFPFAMITRKVGAALAVGCTVVVKPAQDTPLCALALAELGDAAGVPPGVFNVITCRDPVEVGRVLCTHPRVRVVSFTGSTAVGKGLLRDASTSVKKVALELGGNAPLLVFADADLDLAVRGAVASKFRNSGQTCVCVNRVLVERSVVESFAAKLDEAIAALVVGPGAATGTTIGPLINERAVRKVEALVADAVQRGATVVRGGARHGDVGTYYEPTLLRGVNPDMAIAQEEIFGPVASIIEFADEGAAIAQANDTPSGLSAYAYTSNLARAWRLAEQLEFGIIGINDTAISTPVAPFGGMKESGLGREGGAEGIDEFLDTHAVRIGVPPS
jgi:succinate-semialdehyde dehydrogenase / glutarate-semialdehyde dehydrogenase